MRLARWLGEVQMTIARAVALFLLVGFTASEAAAQFPDLSGRYRCVQLCRDGLLGEPAFITQNGREMNLLNEAGEPSRAWIDWNGRIWAPGFNEGAVYSADGSVLHFDRGTVWQREVPEEPRRRARAAPAPAAAAATAPRERVERRARPARADERAALARAAFDGSWSVVISTRSGGCDPEYRFGIDIVDGNVVYGGGASPASVQGSVSARGAVWVSVTSGGQRADGQGRLLRNTGSGTWSGQGMAGACAGVWQAARRG
jgi:hypothetical protein